MVRIRHQTVDGWLVDLQSAARNLSQAVEVRLTSSQAPVDGEPRPTWQVYVTAGFVDQQGRLVELTQYIGASTGHNAADVETRKCQVLDRLRSAAGQFTTEILAGRFEPVPDPV